MNEKCECGSYNRVKVVRDVNKSSYGKLYMKCELCTRWVWYGTGGGTPTTTSTVVRDVATQGPTTYKVKYKKPRFDVIAEDEQGAFV